MIIRPFAVEEWMNAWETGARFNIAETCVDSLSADELFALTGTDRNSFLNAFCSRKMTYGDMEGNLLKEIADIARRADAYVLCDEVYRGLTREEANTPSIADLYEKGIAVGSMSKVFSLAGLRLGWIACRDQEVTRSFLSHRDYNLISCGLFDEALAAVALEHQDAVLGRSRRIMWENLAILDAWVQNEPMVHYIRPQAGTTALICYDSGMDARAFCRELLKETGTLLTPGECFEESRCFRVGYACDQETLRSGLKAVSRFIHGR